MPTQAIEEYLESIYKLHSRGVKVIAARLAEDLGVAAPTVTEMLRRLRAEGFVVIRRHRLSERLLTDILGMPWSEAHEEACKFEHVISPAVEARLARALDYPTTCPHGNPIPGSPGEGEVLLRLSQVAVGARGVLRCVEAEDEELLSYVEGLGLVPGELIEVDGYAPLDGPVEVKVGSRTVFVGLAAAERLLIKPQD